MGLDDVFRLALQTGGCSSDLLKAPVKQKGGLSKSIRQRISFENDDDDTLAVLAEGAGHAGSRRRSNAGFDAFAMLQLEQLVGIDPASLPFESGVRVEHLAAVFAGTYDPLKVWVFDSVVAQQCQIVRRRSVLSIGEPVRVRILRMIEPQVLRHGVHFLHEALHVGLRARVDPVGEVQ